MSTRAERRAARRLAGKLASSEGKKCPNDEDRQKKQNGASGDQPPEAHGPLPPSGKFEAIQSAQNHQEPETKRRGKCKMILSTIDWMIVFNGVIAVFTIVLAFSAIYQWKATVAQNEIMIEQGKAIERQAKLAEDQLVETRASIRQTDEALKLTRMQLRPWLEVIAPDLKPFEAGTKTQITLHIFNTGNTPAIITDSKVFTFNDSGQLSLAQITEAFDRLATVEHQTTRVPAQKSTDIEIVRGVPLNETVIKSIRSGDSILYLIGRLSYKDLEGNPDTIDFQYMYEPDTNRLMLASEVTQEELRNKKKPKHDSPPISK